MFFEESFAHSRQGVGTIEVICGSMFSGKTEELLRRLRRVEYAGQRMMIFKPEIDNRYAQEYVVSHDQRKLNAKVVNASQEIVTLVSHQTLDVVAIDEAQFFDEDLQDVAETLANGGRRVILAGLDMDYLGQPFGVMPSLLARADYITKLHAICVHCGNIAQFTYRKVSSTERNLVGAKDSYEPRCRSCYHKK